jgi:hypothetical protein
MAEDVTRSMHGVNAVAHVASGPIIARARSRQGMRAPLAQQVVYMSHVVLLGDSVFDNGAYTSGDPAVIDQVHRQLPSGWRATLRAIDGAVTGDVPRQLGALPRDATHLVLSVGGNDALGHAGLLETRVSSTREALLRFADAAHDFAERYAGMLSACVATKLPLAVCTIYHGYFPEPDYRRAIPVALAAFNDAIIAEATRHRLKVIDLRRICTQARDYANPIEPSSVGGEKIAAAIVAAVTEPWPAVRGAYICS